jgi:hypothetical protein
MKRLVISFCLLFVAIGQVRSGDAQETVGYYLPGGVSYDPSVPTPESFFGFQVGEWHLRHDQLIAYVEAVARVSDRISIQEYARSYEHRRLMLLTVTSPDNHRDLKQIQAEHLRLSEPSVSDSLDLERMPAVLWMGYSIHGNEASGSNAVPVVIYHLAAARGTAIEEMLDRTIILIDPSFNPDGMGRFAQWANSHRGKLLNGDPNHREHVEVWPGGRTNHYWFDLNRDWLPSQHPESQGRIKLFHEWKPNVLTDHHEMGTDRTYFFQPGVPSRNNPLTPKHTYDLTAKMAAYHARALDEIGSLYYTKEGFDDFYVGKGSTYPDLNGAVGILFEQASARGHLQESENGPVSFPFGIRNQVRTTLSTLQAVQELRPELLSHQRQFYKSAMEEAQRSSVKAYLFSSAEDPARAHHFLSLLLRHRVKVYQLAKATRVENTDFRPGSAYAVPVEQPQFRLIKSIFEKRTTFADSLFYDVSSWTLPLAFNLTQDEYRSKALPSDLLGDRVDQAVFPAGELKGSSRAYAYAFGWEGYYAPRALNRLLDLGIRAKVSTKPFETVVDSARIRFGYGSIIVPVKNQSVRRGQIDSVVAEIVRKDALTVYALDTGLAVKGVDLGSPSLKTISRPSTAVLVGDGVAATAGEAWHLLDRRVEMEVSLLETARITTGNLARYNRIVMPDGPYSSVDSTRQAALRGWVRTGGTLVAMGRGARWMVKKRISQSKLKTTDNQIPTGRREYSDASRDKGAQVIGGAIFEASLDRSHPIGYGYLDEKIPVFRRGTVFLEPAKSPYATPLQYTAFPLLSGYVSGKNERVLKNSASIIVEKSGRGRIILMADNPIFRAFWYGTNKLFLNAIFFGDLIEADSLADEVED